MAHPVVQPAARGAERTACRQGARSAMTARASEEEAAVAEIIVGRPEKKIKATASCYARSNSIDRTPCPQAVSLQGTALHTCLG